MSHFYGPSKLLRSPAELQQFLADEQATPSGVTAVRFGEDFGLRDEHIKELVGVQDLAARLQSIYLGSSDTGDGTWLTDAAVLAIVRACPGLRQLALCSCTSVTDKAFLAVVEGLPNLECLHCTGHDKCSGQLTDKALAPLIQGKLPRLRQLYITDQINVRYNKVEQLLKKRRTLQLQAGETDSDSAAWGCVLAAQGRSYGDGLYGRW